MSDKLKVWQEVKAMEDELDRLRLKMAEIRATVIVNIERGGPVDAMEVLRFFRQVFFPEAERDE